MKQQSIGWQWHQLDQMQIICTSLRTHNHNVTSSLIFYRPDALSGAQPTVSMDIWIDKVKLCKAKLRQEISRSLSTANTTSDNVTMNQTRNTGTLHTSTKARLTSVATRSWIRDLNRHQNLIISSLAHCQPSPKISCKSVLKFFAQSC